MALRRGVETVTVADLYRRTTVGANDRGPLPLRVSRDVDAPAEREAAGGKRLRQGGLPPADHSGEEHIGIGDQTLLVQTPGVEPEPSAGPRVVADQDPLGPEAGLGQERVGDRQDVARGPVRGGAEAAVGAQGCRAGLAPPWEVGGLAAGLSLGSERGFPFLDQRMAGTGFDPPCRFRFCPPLSARQARGHISGRPEGMVGSCTRAGMFRTCPFARLCRRRSIGRVEGCIRRDRRSTVRDVWPSRA